MHTGERIVAVPMIDRVHGMRRHDAEKGLGGARY